MRPLQSIWNASFERQSQIRCVELYLWSCRNYQHIGEHLGYVCVCVCTFTLNCKTTNLIAQKPNKTQHDGNCVPLALALSVCLSVCGTGCLVGWQAESVPEMLGHVEVLSCWNDANTITREGTATTITSAKQPWTWKVKRTLPRDVKQFMGALTLIAADVQIIIAGSAMRSWNSFLAFIVAYFCSFLGLRSRHMWALRFKISKWFAFKELFSLKY